MSRKKAKIPPYLYKDEVSRNFAMIPPDLLEAEEFQALGHAARLFYITICVHVATEEQRSCCYQTLMAYRDILKLDMSDEDVKYATWGNRRTSTFSRLFVFPESHMKAYGYTSQYANKLKKELIEHGFIRVKYAGKGKHTGWSKNVTVYEFSDEWKKHS